MNPLKSPLKRTTAAIAGAALGLTGALAFAAPAAAHHTTITGVTACTPSGDWTVTWTVVNSEARKVATIKQVFVQPLNGTVDGVVAGGEIPAGGQIIGTQQLSKNQYNAELSIIAEWLTKANGQPDPTPPKSSDHGYAFRPETCPSTAPSKPTEAEPTPEPVKPTPVKPTPEPVKPSPVKPTATPDDVPPTPSATPAAPAAGDEEPTLPKTGVAVGGIAGGAAVLLAVGAGLFFLARRRKLKFTV
ncbi:MAG TPA: LPXTG cell wall anchor domain-containing protein [Actinoplanes sp.]|nr:LPXTG cell wall anchor domain-containing protein [Actinoplanes sp.]